MVSSSLGPLPYTLLVISVLLSTYRPLYLLPKGLGFVTARMSKVSRGNLGAGNTVYRPLVSPSGICSSTV